MDDDAEKTEQPTARRRQEAREQGQVARSLELTAAATLLFSLLLLNCTGRDMFGQMLVLTRAVGETAPLRPADVWVEIRRAARASAEMLGPFLLWLTLIPLASTLLQTGWTPNVKKVLPSLEKLNPTKGLRRLLSMDSATHLAISLCKAALVTGVVYVTIRDCMDQTLAAGAAEPPGILWLASATVYTLALRVALLLLIVGVVDYLYQRWKLEKSLRMTKQEVKDEMKRMEGDPLVRQRRRQVQLRLALQRIGVDVPKADVVVTNPTEYAVALRYDEARMAAPRVLAKGKDLLAQRIRQVALAHGVPIVQRPPLARALYAACEPGDEIPPAYYRAVAEVLAFVYRLAGRAAQTGGAGARAAK